MYNNLFNHFPIINIYFLSTVPYNIAINTDILEMIVFDSK